MPEEFEVLACRRSDLPVAPPSRNDLRVLPRVTLETSQDELLEEISGRALRVLGLAWEATNYRFVTAPDSDGRRVQAPFSPYVDADGAVTWVPGQIAFGWGFYSLPGVRIQDVIRTQKEGLFTGDPFALLIDEPRGAGGGLPEWADLIRFLDQAGMVYAGLTALQKSVQVLRSIVATYRRQWEARNATPLPLFVFILQREAWRYPELAQWLKVSLATVVDLLLALGYEQDARDRQVYRLSSEVSQAALRSALENDVLGGNPREALRSFWENQGTAPRSG